MRNFKVYLRDKPSLQKLIVDSCLSKPNEKCYVCATKPELILKINVEKFTVKQLETQVQSFLSIFFFQNNNFSLNKGFKNWT